MTAAGETKSKFGLQIFDITDYENVHCIHTEERFRELCSDPTRLLNTIRQSRTYDSELSVAGRKWLLIGVTDQMPLFTRVSSTTWAIFFGGATIVYLLSSYLLSLWSRKVAVEELVRSRTSELRMANLNLKSEGEQKNRANSDLKTSEERFKHIVDRSPHPIIILHELLGEIYYVNKAAIDLFKLPNADFGNSVSVSFFSDPDKQQQLRDKFIAEGSFSMEGASLLKFTGETFDGEISAVPITYCGNPCAYTVVTDISDRKRAERQKSEFVATVSHELKTPLTSVMGSLGLIKGGAAGSTSDKVDSLINIAHKNCERLVRLVNDILDIQRIEAGLMTIDLGAVKPTEIVSEALQTSKGVIDQYGIQVRTELAWVDDVYVDRDLLVQVVTNFLSNAAKFSEPGGEITVHTSQNEKYIRFSVRDSGPGIPDEFRPFVFERFSQADGSDARKRGGSGLGLSICKTIAERHSANIGFESPSTGGSIFFIDVPIAHKAMIHEDQADEGHLISA
jgi:PAS domain S-box-containing protein